jgi:hypothetical protein
MASVSLVDGGATAGLNVLRDMGRDAEAHNGKEGQFNTGGGKTPRTA